MTAESLVDEVLEELVTRYGKEWDGRGPQKRSGKRPLEASASVVGYYDLPCTPAVFYNEAIALLQDRFGMIFLPADIKSWNQSQASIALNLGKIEPADMFTATDSGIGGALPMEPWYMSGPVLKAFGRGSRNSYWYIFILLICYVFLQLVV